MKQISLYYSRKENTYFHIGYIKCEACMDEMKEDFYLIEMDKKNERHLVCPLCSKCFQTNKQSLYSPITQYKYGVITKIIPQGAIPVIQKRQELSDGEISIYDVNEIKSVRTIDRTVHSSRSDWEGSRIGVMPEDKQDNIDVDGFFEQIKLAKPDIPKELKHDG
jgi:hypothetical protein